MLGSDCPSVIEKIKNKTKLVPDDRREADSFDSRKALVYYSKSNSEHA